MLDICSALQAAVHLKAAGIACMQALPVRRHRTAAVTTSVTHPPYCNLRFQRCMLQLTALRTALTLHVAFLMLHIWFPNSPNAAHCPNVAHGFSQAALTLHTVPDSAHWFGKQP